MSVSEHAAMWSLVKKKYMLAYFKKDFNDSIIVTKTIT